LWQTSPVSSFLSFLSRKKIFFFFSTVALHFRLARIICSDVLQQCRTLFPSHLPKNEIRQKEGFLEKLIVAKSHIPCFFATNGTKSPITPLTFAPFIFIAIVTIIKTKKTYKFINIRRSREFHSSGSLSSLNHYYFYYILCYFFRVFGFFLARTCFSITTAQCSSHIRNKSKRVPSNLRGLNHHGYLWSIPSISRQAFHSCKCSCYV